MIPRLREGRWPYTVDEKGRVPIPPKIRKQVGKNWVWAFDPFRYEVVLLPLEVWQRMVAEAKNPNQLTIEWHPFEDELDPQGRLDIPPEIRELGEIGRDVRVISMGDRLVVKNIFTTEETVLCETPRPFQSGEEADRWLSRGDNVAYFSRPDRVIVGKLILGNGIVFTLNGKDKYGSMVSVHQIPYCSLYPLRPKQTKKVGSKKENFSDKLLSKFPDFDPDWPDKKKRQWFDDFRRLLLVSKLA